MGMHHLGHVYIPMLTAYQFMHAPLDLYAMQWKLGPGGGAAMHFVTILFALVKALPAGVKAINRVRNTVEEHACDLM